MEPNDRPASLPTHKSVVIGQDPHLAADIMCTRDATHCVLCNMIGMIFDGFPTEVNPGCVAGGK